MSHNGRATKPTTKLPRRRLTLAVRYWGLFSRVARELGLDRSHVRRVALGQRRSREVERAIAREVARLEKEAA